MLQTHPEATDRQTRILDAAERCFVRAGFHRTTMQDVAAEAGMSAGNLYRYFPSKESVVEGLCERDRRDFAADFAAFDESSDFMSTFESLGHKHFENEPRDKAVLCLQIWAEAARSPVVAGYAADVADDIVGRLSALIEHARAAGRITPTLGSRAIATLIATLGDGLMVRRAVVPDFDPATEVPGVIALIGALVSGHMPGPAGACSSLSSSETEIVA